MANWPTHAQKRALKRPNRRRTIAELARGQLAKERPAVSGSDTYAVTSLLSYMQPGRFTAPAAMVANRCRRVLAFLHGHTPARGVGAPDARRACRRSCMAQA